MKDYRHTRAHIDEFSLNIMSQLSSI